MPEVSVLIPTYNRAVLLVDAVESVRSQTHKDWEMIVVDDGSTDDTADVVGRLGWPVSYICQPNLGVSAARNRAFRESSAEFVLFLDSDDYLLPNSLEALSTCLRQAAVRQVVHSDAYLVDRAGRRVGELSTYRGTPVPDGLESFVLRSPIHLGTVMMRREALALVEGPFDEQMLGYEDWDLFIRLKAAGCRFEYVPEFTCCYRFHGGNKSAPKSALAEKRRLSLIHSRMKVLNAPWFEGLALPARKQFFAGLLSGPLLGDAAGQDGVLGHPAFLGLPGRDRSELLYRLAVECLLAGAERSRERRRLVQAARLLPTDPRPYLLLSTFPLGSHLQRHLLRAYRRMRAQREAPDPVIRILRDAGVA